MGTAQRPGSLPAGVEILFLHPIGLDQAFWSQILPGSAAAIDFPGHGSAPRAEEVSLTGLVDYVVGHIRDPVTLVGLSLGGMVAQQVALREPDAVSSVVVACSGPASHPQVMRERARATRDRGMRGVLDTTLERWFTPDALADPAHPGVSYARQRLLDDDPDVVAQYWEAMAAHDVESRLPDIKVPATFIAGSADRAASVETLERMAKTVPGAVLEVVEGPHMLPLERPSELRAAIDRHLSRLPRH